MESLKKSLTHVWWNWTAWREAAAQTRFCKPDNDKDNDNNDNDIDNDNDNKEYNVECRLTFLALKSMISSSMPELKLNMEGTPGDQVPTSWLECR